MSVRGTLGGAFAATAIVIIGWQVGAAASANSSLATTATGSTGTVTGSGTQSTPTPSSTSTAEASSGSTSSSSSTPSPTATASTSSKDGTYTGDVEQTRFGPVQVSITVSNGKITDVTALQLTNSDGRSQQISAYAAPILQQEVLAAQSANVSFVSGATYTSDAYLQSVQSALDQAGL